MKLYTMYIDHEKEQIVLGGYGEGKMQFFHQGFQSNEEAKEITFNALLNARMKEHEGSKRPTSIDKEFVEASLQGEWKPIE